MIRLAVLLALIATPAAASQCAQRDALVAALAKSYRESRQAVALGINGGVMEVFANPETQTWTMMLSKPDGISCIFGSGRGFALVNEPLPPEGAPG